MNSSINKLGLILFLVIPISLFSQNTKEIFGKIVDQKSKLPIEFVTVVLNNSTTNEYITATTTDSEGKFNIKTFEKEFYIEVNFIGFKTKKIEEIDRNKSAIDLKIIVLEIENQALDEVVVIGEKSQTQFKLDKRIFNVGKDLSSSGTSALEVLNNVPSVNVSIEGAISLRGSTGVQILINGKPSVLTNGESNALGTITADMIEKVEVITNPSAKYDAEGTSGIINIVLRKSEKRGLNGSITLNTGIPTNHSIGISLNRRTEKFNLFGQLGFGKRTFPSDYNATNQDFINNTILKSNGDDEKHETFYNAILGTDYYINPLNIITLSGTFAYEKEREESNTAFQFSENSVLQNTWDRIEETKATNPKWAYELQYKKDFENHKERSLIISALGSFFGKDQSSTFDETTLFGTRANTQQLTRTDIKIATYTFKADYTHPFAEKYSIEAGSQFVINDVSNDFGVSNLEGAQFVLDPNFTNIFSLNQNVLSVYSTASYEGEKWGVKAGARMENTQLDTELETTGMKREQSYIDFFPSVHTSYKISNNLSIQAGYSRRIYRPRMWDLNPFFSIRNNFNISTGNPNLNPEYTNSYELTSIFNIGKAFFNLTTFYRNTTDVIERVLTFENNVSIQSPNNVGKSNTTGIELNAKISPFSWATLSSDFNYSYLDRKGSFEETSFDFSNDQWNSKATAKFKLPANFEFEISGNYRSKYKTFQRKFNENLYANLGIRKKILKGKASLNISVRDIFASRNQNNETYNQTDYFISRFNESGRFVTFGVSYGFGKGEAMEFSGQKRF